MAIYQCLKNNIVIILACPESNSVILACPESVFDSGVVRLRRTPQNDKITMIIVTGSLAFDYILDFPGRFSDQIIPEKIHQINISFTTENLKREFGGTAGNQAYNLSLLGIDTAILATAGSDFGEYKTYLKKAGVNVDYIKIIPNKLTASGFVLTDKSDNQIWGFAKSAMNDAGKLSLKNIKEKIDFVAITPNATSAIIKMVDECIDRKIPFLFDPAFYISLLSEKDLSKGIKNARIIIGNDYEIAMINKKIKPKYTKEQIIIITLGSSGSLIKRGRETFIIKPAKALKVVDPTGAGDAYRSGFLAGYIKGYDSQTCGQMGSVASVYTVEKYGTQTHRYTKADFIKRYRENFKENIIL